MSPVNLLPKNSTRLRVETSNLIVSGISDVGLIRATNEDHIWIHDSGTVLLLADGMGGHERGDYASRIAVETFSRLISPEIINEQAEHISVSEETPPEEASFYTTISGAVHKAAAVMVERNSELNLSKYMGTTIVGCLISDDDKICWFHIGDSRVYRWRGNRLECLTVDHSAYAEWEKAGASGPAPAKHYITRVIGNKPDVEADIEWDEKKAGDIYLLCSDGLSDMITDAEIGEILGWGESIPDTAEILVNKALSAGGRDNISVILCKIL